MTCAEFDRRLDDAGIAALDREALDHATQCARCAAALAAAREIEGALAAFSAAAPAGFTERVMKRVSGSTRRARVWSVPFELDWWVRAAADPAAALAVAVTGLLVWRGDAALKLASALVSEGFAGMVAWLGRWPSIPAPSARMMTQFSNPLVVTALALAVAPAMIWASWRLFTWAERACTPARPRLGARAAR